VVSTQSAVSTVERSGAVIVVIAAPVGPAAVVYDSQIQDFETVPGCELLDPAVCSVAFCPNCPPAVQQRNLSPNLNSNYGYFV